MDKEVLKKNIATMKTELESMEAQLVECAKPKLHLEISMYGNLCVAYRDQYVGTINVEGRCHIVSNINSVAEYEQWREDGMLIDNESIVAWKNGTYQLQYGGCLSRTDVQLGAIYSFKDCLYKAKCMDSNIIRHKHNNRPVGF